MKKTLGAVVIGATSITLTLGVGPASAVATRLPHPGHTYTLKDGNGNKARVKLLHVYDPGTLRDSNGDKDYPPSGKKWVVAAFRIKDKKGKIDEDIYDDFSIVGKNHQTYNAYITGDTTYNGYTDFDNGEIQLRHKGEYLVGAAPVLMPARVGVGTVVWAMGDGFGQTGSWRG